MGLVIVVVPVALVVLAVLRTASVRRRLRRTGSTGLQPGQQRAFWIGLVALDIGAGLTASGHDALAAIAFVLVTFAAAPLLLWSLPEWWVRRILAAWRLYRVAAHASRPLVAFLVAAAILLASGLIQPTPLVLATWAVGGFVVWLPLLSPLPEHRRVEVASRFS